MDLKKELEGLKQSREKLIQQINAIEQQKQLMLQEILRTDGKIDMLQRVIAGQKDGDSARIKKEVKP